MADDNQDSSQKTEDPTPKRLEDAKQKGQVITSREITSFALLLLLLILIGSFSDEIMTQARIVMVPFIEKPDLLQVDQNGLSQLLKHITLAGLALITLPLLASMAIAIAANYLQHGHIFSAESMKPKLDRISLIAGAKRLFSMRSVVEFLKGVIKISIVAITIWLSISSELAVLKNLPDDSIEDFLHFLLAVITKMLIAVCICMFFIALFDYLYQRYEFMKNMRMSKQDIKDEYKQQEGDPKVKQKLRQIRAERARNRMMASVPQADVIITNPTHFAIALKYDSNTMKAPVVLAKGIDFLAQKIREIAEENNIPMVRNPPLARALYDSAEIDQEIPLAHYKAVAEVISYVYKLQGKTRRKKRLGI